MNENYYFGSVIYPNAKNPALATLRYLFRDGGVYYRVIDLHHVALGFVGKVNAAEMKKKYNGGEYILCEDSTNAGRCTGYVSLDGALYLVEHFRNRDFESLLNFTKWLKELNETLAPKAAAWEPEQPPEEPPAQEQTEDKTAEQPEPKVAKAEPAQKEPEAAKQPEKPKKCQCKCKEKPPVFPNITSGQVAAATQMVEVWKAAGIDNKMIAMALNGFFPNLSLPVGAFTDTDTEYYSANAIAQYVGVYSKKGNPHGGAVAAVIKGFIQPKDEDVCKLPFNQNGHSGVCTQYSAAVLAQVEDWFDREQYPESIGVDGKTYQLCYEAP